MHASLVITDGRPHLLDEWTVVAHYKVEPFTWDPGRVSLYHPPSSLGVETVLARELWRRTFLNWSAMDWLLTHPGFIPSEWEPENGGPHGGIIFAGTIAQHDWRWWCHTRVLVRQKNRWDWEFRTTWIPQRKVAFATLLK